MLDFEIRIQKDKEEVTEVDKKLFCQVNVWIETEDGLQEWLDTFADDPAFLTQSLYVNLLDGVDSEQTRETIGTFCGQYPENASGYAMPQQSYAVCYNMVRGSAENFAWVNYTTTATSLKASGLAKMQEKIGGNGETGIWSFYPVGLLPNGKTKAYLPFAAKDRHHSDEEFSRFSMYLPGYLIRSDLVRSAGFDENAPEDADVQFLVRAIMEGKDYVLTKIPLKTAEPFENDYYNYRRQYNPAWYTRTLREVYLPLLKAHPDSSFAQAMAMYQISIRFACNRNDRSKNLLQGEALDRFFETVSQVLELVDDSIAVTYNMNRMKMLPKYMGLVFLRLKYRDPELMPVISVEDAAVGAYTAMHHEAKLDNHTTLRAAITCLDYNKRTKELVIDGRLTNAYVFDYDQIRCQLVMGDRRIDAVPTRVYSLDKYFGISMYRDYTFQVRISADEMRAGSTLAIRFRCGEVERSLPLTFPRMESRLTDRFPHSYWNFGNYMMTLDLQNNRIRVNARKGIRTLLQELKLYTDFIRYTPKSGMVRALKSIMLRMAYWATKPLFRKKQVWLTFDQLFKGGDNGEYFFRYVSDHHADAVDMYYVANANCADYQRLQKKYKKLLPFNSLKEKLVALHTDCVFATRVDVKQYCGFGPQLEYYHRGLINYDVFCLQHGLTIQRIAQYQNRLFDNTKLYFCVSPNEIENLSHPVYGYDPEMLLMTGAPRYDGLVNDDQKQILIAPTWRRNVTAGTNRKGHQHEYSINFKETEYYRIYNGLINNRKLIDCARETGYRIIYLVHPILSPQVGDFKGPEQVTILGGAGGNVSYEKMMCQSSLMLTDHSGIQFDFASMRKPLVYYHPDTLPPQYDAGGMNYETQAFGPVCRNEEEVVEALCRAMRSNCVMEEKYRARADAFFTFDDHDNCKRVFEAAVKHQGLEGKGK